MIKDLQVSLYDIFGYIIPGLVAMAALGALFLGFFVPALELAAIPRGLWSAVVYVVTAYIFGHGVQAISNLLNKFFRAPEDEMFSTGSEHTCCPAIFLEASRKKLAEALRLPEVDLSPRWLYRACDAAASSDRLAERDLYTYREGFYRGMAVSSLIWSVVTLILLGRRCIKYPATRLVFPHGAFELNAKVLTFVLLLTMAATYLFFTRYRRFAAYRVSAALLGFLFSTQPSLVKENEPPLP